MTTSFSGLVTLMSGAMLAPALKNIAKDLHTGSSTTQIVLSIYVLAFAFGPLVLAPLTEVYGRKPIWIYSGLFYLVWNSIAGIGHSKGLMVTARLLAGLGASAEFAVTNPVLNDCWKPEERGHSLALSTFLPLLGGALGPVLGGITNETIGWQWIFWLLSLISAAATLFGLFAFKETHGPTILQAKAKALRKATGDHRYHTASRQYSSTRLAIATAVKRPALLYAHQPILQILSLFLAYNYGVLYLVLTTYVNVWTDRYHQDTLTASLHYFAIVIGYTLASQVGSRITDSVWARLKEKNHGQTSPEYRIPLMFPGTLLIPVGLLWSGWAAQNKTYWLVTDIGALIFGCGTILSTQAMIAYVMDCFPGQVASAIASAFFLRCVAGFAFPIFAPDLYSHLGYGWGNTAIAAVYVVIGIPGPLLLGKYGAMLRQRGRTVE